MSEPDRTEDAREAILSAARALICELEQVWDEVPYQHRSYLQADARRVRERVEAVDADIRLIWDDLADLCVTLFRCGASLEKQADFVAARQQARQVLLTHPRPDTV